MLTRIRPLIALAVLAAPLANGPQGAAEDDTAVRAAVAFGVEGYT